MFLRHTQRVRNIQELTDFVKISEFLYDSCTYLYSTTSQTQTDKCFAFISFLLPEDITILTITKYIPFRAEVKSKAYLGPSHILILLEK